MANVARCCFSLSESCSASASAASTACAGLVSLPLCGRSRYSTLKPASAASSSRRNPEVRRRPKEGNPTCSGLSFSRRDRRNGISPALVNSVDSVIGEHISHPKVSEAHVHLTICNGASDCCRDAPRQGFRRRLTQRQPIKHSSCQH